VTLPRLDAAGERWERSEGAPDDDGRRVLACTKSNLAVMPALAFQLVTAENGVAWEQPEGRGDYRVPIADVEHAVRQACRRWNVREVAADPFRWQRTLQALDAEGIPVVEFPQSPARMSPATSLFYTAVMNRGLTHSGDPRLARHVRNC
jgi:hypothetical protein